MLDLQIVTPERTVVKVDCKLITLPGKSGEFQVLNGHTNMLASLRTGILSFEPNDINNLLKDFKFSLNNFKLMIANGFVEICNDSVIVLCDFAALPNEIDVVLSKKLAIKLQKKLDKLNNLDENFFNIKDELEQTMVKLLIV